MNNFIFAYIKEKESVEISLNTTSLDMVFGAVSGNHFQKIKDVNHYDMVFAYESASGYINSDNPNIFLLGDPYVTNINNKKSFIEIVEQNDPQAIFSEMSGAFCWCEFDECNSHFSLHTDIFGQMPIFYFESKEIFIISSSIHILIETLKNIPRTVNMERIIEFIVTGKIHDQNDSFFKHIHRLPGNRKLTYSLEKQTHNITELVSLNNYRDQSKKLTSENLKEDLEEVIKSATFNKTTAYSVSGGVDSTLIQAIGAIVDTNPLSCYTASTGYGNDLSFSQKATDYIHGELYEVEMDYDEDKLEFIYQVIQAHGMPLSIRGSSIAFPFICQAAQKDNMDIILNGTSEFFISGGIYASFIGPSYFRYCVQNFQFQELFSLIPVYLQKKVMKKRLMIAEIFRSWFVYSKVDSEIYESLHGKDFKNFFNKEIQQIRDNMTVKRKIFIDYKNDLLDEITNGEAQRLSYQAYQGSIINHIHSRTPFLDTRLIKYIDIDEKIRFYSDFSKQFERDAMKGIMDESVVYRKDNEGLRWRSTVLLKKNKQKMIDEIKASNFLKSILSKKTLGSLNQPTFRKSLLLSLYSVALFDKAFHITKDELIGTI